MSVLRVAVVGAGVIGRTHVDTLGRLDGLALAGIVEPSPAAAGLAAALGVPLFADAEALIAAEIADAAIVASPNHTHVPVATMLLEAGLPVLVEKPLADSVAAAAALVRTVERTGQPLLLGHHRRHNPIIRAAKAAIAGGRIGGLVTAVVNSVLTKPEPYFEVAWRRTAGQGGPLAINMSHEIDLLRHFFGEIAEVRALVSNARRGLEVEDTAAAILAFEVGGIATITVTDAGCGPWAWDVSAGENPARFPAHDVVAHAYAGTRAALSLPDLALWSHPGTPDWTVEMRCETLPAERADPYERQLLHFAATIREGVPPLVDAWDGLRNMMVLEAIRRSAATGQAVALAETAPEGVEMEAAP